jgi:hypothetical protein
MGRLIFALFMMLTMSGCAVVGAVGGAAVEGMVYMFRGEEESFSITMRSALVAAQRGLKKADLNADILEPTEKGYLIGFGNENLSGVISLEKQTSHLTTVEVKVRSGPMREDSIERAILISIREQAKKASRSDRFNFRGYKYVREKPETSSKQVGWYLPGAKLDVKTMSKSVWLRVKMPSGKQAFLKGSLAAFESK